MPGACLVGHAVVWYHSDMVWTISDLHLSAAHAKPMDIFGGRWKNHPERIAAAWRARVAPDDVVLIAGDISWAMHLPDALLDLQWVDQLPGQKILCKGNHDYWWDRAGPLRPFLPPSIRVVEADALIAGEIVVCGTRGWAAPGTPGFKPETDTRVYNRELGRLDRALAMGRKLAASTRPLVVMIHFPPFIDRRPTEFARRISAAGAATCIYGHLHRPDDWSAAVQGEVDGVFYQLTACDYLGFGPVGVRGIARD